jgi:hypothetical protein
LRFALDRPNLLWIDNLYLERLSVVKAGCNLCAHYPLANRGVELVDVSGRDHSFDQVASA